MADEPEALAACAPDKGYFDVLCECSGAAAGIGRCVRAV